MDNQKIFIVHGRADKALKNLLAWFKRRSFGIKIIPITFEKSFQPGKTIPEELERIAKEGDAAIILATPDDLGRLKSSRSSAPRARQNVWIELGWFWARLGRTRTLLILNGKLDVPSDLQGILYLYYVKSLKKISKVLEMFITNLQSADTDSLTEVVFVASNVGQREQHYIDVASAAEQHLIISGIGMSRVKDSLATYIHDLVNIRKALRIDFLTIDKDLFSSFSTLITTSYRDHIFDDICKFESELSNLLKEFPSVKSRVQLFRYPGIMTFSATVADPGKWGSSMLVETILPKTHLPKLSRPRILLKKRVTGGLYDHYEIALSKMMNTKNLANDI